MPAEWKLLDLPRQSAVPVTERGGVQMTQEAERFLIQAKSAVYAGAAGEADSSPLRSHSRLYADGKFRYTDSCLGTEQFAGQEVLLEGESPVWAVNYVGRILERDFPINFLREALLAGCCSFPYRGREQYEKGDWIYHCTARGEPDWFYGYEEILYRNRRIYECAFHGGEIR